MYVEELCSLLFTLFFNLQQNVKNRLLFHEFPLAREPSRFIINESSSSSDTTSLSSRLLFLRRLIVLLSQRAASCLSQHAAKAKIEQSRTIKFLAGLNEKYSIIRSQILMRKFLPDLAEICNILDQDDSQRQFNSVIAPAAFQVSHGTPQPTVLHVSSNSAPLLHLVVIQTLLNKAR